MNLPDQTNKWAVIIARMCLRDHQFLQCGRQYQVTREFVDYDKCVHPSGERWVFIGSSFVPYEDGMSFFVSFDDVHESQIRLQWRPEAQAEILDKLSEYIAVAPAG